MPEKIKFTHKSAERKKGERGVEKFSKLDAFYDAAAKTIIVHQDEYELSFSMAGGTIKMSSAIKHTAQTADYGRVPPHIVDEARKKAYVVLKIIGNRQKKKADDSQLDLFKHD